MTGANKGSGPYRTLPAAVFTGTTDAVAIAFINTGRDIREFIQENAGD